MRYANLIARLLASAALGAAASAASARTLDVVASFTVLADVVQQVGGDHVRVKSLVPANGDPHEFEPSPNDAKAIKSADVTFVSGEGLESWFQRLAKAAGYNGKPVVASNGVKTQKMEEDGKTVTDPHVWNTPLNVIVWTGNIEKALAAADPQDAADFKANAAKYVQELQDLNAYAHAKFDATPKDLRKVLTSHDAFGYFGKEYGVTFLSPLGLSTETEASAAGVAKLIDQIRREKVKIYFIENSNDPRLVKQIAEATGAEPGGVLYVESLSPPDGPAPTYARMLRNSVDKIADAIAKQSSAAAESR
ncbi:periplasmic solute binding protein [Methylocella silvestris BL2]|uniref:Periplasmic solute binding protein n=1 Tax=Methylocella silvestris (strain DSM 15510 / CIP 108128 / LMG 27833 / NCIMB 13906 / BL2) TaxID=395965 RepID=B8ER93_METSB|nr:zinc ABC transporter substrate-binding protein [Methylocella silvestris]ACK50277.1 periplasmic solute binding protein [Methylocella silvestris BL2]